APGLPDRVPRVVAAVPGQPVLLPGLLCEDHLLVRHDRDGECLRAALPLRPADAPGLEDLPADLAGRRGGHRRLADVRGRRMRPVLILLAAAPAYGLGACAVD